MQRTVYATGRSVSVERPAMPILDGQHRSLKVDKMGEVDEMEEMEEMNTYEQAGRSGFCCILHESQRRRLLQYCWDYSCFMDLIIWRIRQNSTCVFQKSLRERK